MERVSVIRNTEREGQRLEAILGIGQRSASRSRLGENLRIAQSASMRYVHRGKIITEFLFILKRVEPRINSSLVTNFLRIFLFYKKDSPLNFLK